MTRIALDGPTPWLFVDLPGLGSFFTAVARTSGGWAIDVSFQLVGIQFGENAGIGVGDRPAGPSLSECQPIQWPALAECVAGLAGRPPNAEAPADRAGGGRA